MNLKKIHFGVAPVIGVSSFQTPVRFIPNNVFFLLSLQTTMTPTRSVGQSAFFSKASKSIASCGGSIVQKLASRSITGNGLQIQIHQHVGFKVHVVWHVFDKHNKKSVRCFERIFSEINALDVFCKQLKDGAFEGLCDCVCNRFIEWMNDKIRPCTLEHSSQEHIRQYVFLRSWERSEEVQQQRRNYFECLCPVSSSCGVGTSIWDSDPDTANLVRYCQLFVNIHRNITG